MTEFALTKTKLKKYVFISSISLLFVFLVCLSLGTIFISPFEVLRVLLGKSNDSTISEVILSLRLPRILTAIIVGASLSIVGTVFQALFKNPLSEPYILGVSSGGALGAVIAISIGLQFAGISFFALTGSFLAFVLVYTFGRKYGDIDPNSLLLSGVMINAFFSALILLIVSTMDQSFRTALFWLMGNLSLTNYSTIFYILTIFIISTFIFLYYSNGYNLISIDEENAIQFGINIRILKNLTLVSGSVLIGTIVSNVGIIGFVGLIVPHICRLIFGYDNRIVMPTSTFIGAIFMLLSDLLSRIILSPVELPIGSITAIIGSPIFIFLLKHKQKTRGD